MMLSVSELAVQQVNVMCGPLEQVKEYERVDNTEYDFDTKVVDYVNHLISLRPDVKGIKPLTVNLYGAPQSVIAYFVAKLKPCCIRLVRSKLGDPSWVNRYNLTYVIESDGSEKYGPELINDDLVREYKNVVVHSTIHKDNQDLYAIKNHVGDHPIEFSICKDRRYLGTNVTVLTDCIHRMAQQLATNMSSGIAQSFEHDVLLSSLDRWLKAYNKHEFFLYPNCGLQYEQVTLALDGSVLVCPQMPIPVEHINTQVHHKTVKIFDQVVNHCLTGKPCKKCDVLCMCNGGCVACSSPELCTYYKAFYSQVLTVVQAMDELKTEIEL